MLSNHSQKLAASAWLSEYERYCSCVFSPSSAPHDKAEAQRRLSGVERTDNFSQLLFVLKDSKLPYAVVTASNALTHLATKHIDSVTAGAIQ